MKKATAILSALLVAVMMMAASVCAAEINLIPEDADWVMTEAGGSGASWSYGENGLTVKDNGAGWPNIAYSLETPLTVDVANATLSYKITNVNTAGNIAILITLSDTEVIVPHRLFTDEGIDFEAGTGYDSGSGDLMNGSYEGEIALANLKVADGINLKDYTPADGKITITAISLYATGGAEYTINELSISDGKTAEESSEAPTESSEAPTTSSEAPAASSGAPASSAGTPSTGDAGVAALVIVAGLSVTGALVLRKRHS